MTFETLRYEVDSGLARLTLDRPDAMNAMTNRMVREARDALGLVAADPSVRVLVLTGEGRAFCPGADLNHFTQGGEDERLTSREFAVTTLLHEVPAVTVAAINGACAGAGLGWALACDLRVMAAGAKLNTAFLDVAVAGDMAIPWSLPRLVGAARARDLSFLPRKVVAEEALQMGLVARVFPDDSFRADTEELLDGLLRKSPTALRGLKEHYVAAERMGLADFVDYEAERHLRIAASEDTAEAFRAFLEIDFQPGGEDPAGPWMPAGQDWQRARRTDVVDGITAVVVQSRQPDRTAARWAEITDHDLDGRVLRLDNATISFVDGPADSLVGVTLSATDRASAGTQRRICGVDFHLG